MSTDNVPNTTVTTISNQEVDFHMVNQESGVIYIVKHRSAVI